MKFNYIFLSIVLIMSKSFAEDIQKANASLVAQQVKKCVCGPVEHWFYKCCVKRYNKEFLDAALHESDDSEGLTQNVAQAIAMLAETVTFVDDEGNVIVPTLTAKGNRIIALSKNSYYKACKDLLRLVDESTNLPAKELYELWLLQLTTLSK